MPAPSLAADILAAVLTLAIPLTGPLERRVYQSNPQTQLKLVFFGCMMILLWVVGGDRRSD
jgi:hypothetical protein